MTVAMPGADDGGGVQDGNSELQEKERLDILSGIGPSELRRHVERMIEENAANETAGQDKSTSTYYTVLSNPPPKFAVPTSLSVPVYHDVLVPSEIDPFNIRGFHDRKPFPAQKTFSCLLEAVSEDEDRVINEEIIWRRGFGPSNTSSSWVDAVRPVDGQFEEVLTQMHAPAGIREGIPQMEANGPVKSSPVTNYAFPMSGLIDMWREPVNAVKEQMIRDRRKELGEMNARQKLRVRRANARADERWGGKKREVSKDSDDTDWLEARLMK
ncbi:hypothetical protein LTR66_015687 [Elasticomyces elasticus]|nr:hypothetical protein LTR66_015687 [Elasticomyces elasticus]